MPLLEIAPTKKVVATITLEESTAANVINTLHSSMPMPTTLSPRRLIMCLTETRTSRSF